VAVTLPVYGWLVCTLLYAVIKSFFVCGGGHPAGHIMADHPLQKHVTVPDDFE
jgi:hypothetical protein